MPFDWQTILAALGGRQPGALGPGGPITGTQQGGPMGQPMQPMAQMAPGRSTTPQQGSGAGLLGAGGGGLGLLGAGAAMLNASGPSATPTGFGKSLGQGLSGFVQGSMADRDLAFQQKQQDSLAQIADIMARQGGGTSQQQGKSPVMLGLPPDAPNLPSGAPAIPNFMARPVMQGVTGGMPTGAPQLPTNTPSAPASPAALAAMPLGMPMGGIPVGASGTIAGGAPMAPPAMVGGPYMPQGQNPFISMLLARRRQGMA